MQVEFVTCYEVIIQAFNNFVPGLHVIDSISILVKIYCDTTIVLFYSKNTRDLVARKTLKLNTWYQR